MSSSLLIDRFRCSQEPRFVSRCFSLSNELRGAGGEDGVGGRWACASAASTFELRQPMLSYAANPLLGSRLTYMPRLCEASAL